MNDRSQPSLQRTRTLLMYLAATWDQMLQGLCQLFQPDRCGLANSAQQEKALANTRARSFGAIRLQ